MLDLLAVERWSDQMGILNYSNSNINVAIAAWDDWASYFKIEDQIIWT